MEYEFQKKSRVLIEKNVDLNVTEISNNQIFNMKSTLLRNKVDNYSLINSLLSTDFYAHIKQKTNESRSISNFNSANDHLFWTLIEAESIDLMYERKFLRYSDWDQLLGPITFSKYDKLQFQFRCLEGEVEHVEKVNLRFLADKKCPIGYSGKVPDCHDINRSRDSLK